MKNSMDINSLFLNRVKYQVVFNNKVSIPHVHQFFFIGNSPELRILREKIEVLFNSYCKRLCSRRSIGGYKIYNFCEVILSYAKKTHCIFRPLHEFSSEGLSLLVKACGIYHRLRAEPVLRQVC